MVKYSTLLYFLFNDVTNRFSLPVNSNMKWFLPLLATCIATTFCSCDAVLTEKPVADSTDAILQEKLTGTWHADEKSFQIAFDTKGIGHAGSLEWRSDTFEISRGEIIATGIEGHYFLSFRSMEDDMPPGYFLSAFTFKDDNTISILPPDLKAIQGLVEKGDTKGKIEKKRYSTTIILPDAKELIRVARPFETYFKAERELLMKRLTD
jgi:hypothetical protein